MYLSSSGFNKTLFGCRSRFWLSNDLREGELIQHTTMRNPNPMKVIECHQDLVDDSFDRQFRQGCSDLGIEGLSQGFGEDADVCSILATLSEIAAILANVLVARMVGIGGLNVPQECHFVNFLDTRAIGTNNLHKHDLMQPIARDSQENPIRAERDAHVRDHASQAVENVP
jgi:hypothetical protein